MPPELDGIGQKLEHASCREPPSITACDMQWQILIESPHRCMHAGCDDRCAIPLSCPTTVLEWTPPNTPPAGIKPSI